MKKIDVKKIDTELPKLFVRPAKTTPRKKSSSAIDDTVYVRIVVIRTKSIPKFSSANFSEL